MHGVEPFAYLKDLLSRIADHPHRRVTKLLPQNWKPATSISQLARLPARWGSPNGYGKPALALINLNRAWNFSALWMVFTPLDSNNSTGGKF
ncbi:MAG: transposase domain-containing protein [candidate division KSB1 bacterium]|nr:transposase domain-containing protein [candidate division KSB1 bacterium]MDZ7368456.1 transposase domain-containing protein [candidate division KSB1 bacterium]MDZ7406182.1 transposase domain-containing protein [candidate division KSB1 bacterium]